RVESLTPSPQTPVIVNCAGRTRSIIGTQSLINAGVPNPVHALRNGTIGWTLAGRVESLTPSPQTPVIVNCAGRTRSIIGTQSLINA
ncbi:sulfurtransferase, partial [Klebsiella pneumoniae]